MLGDPAGVEPELFGGDKELQRDAVRVGCICADLQVGQESKPHSDKGHSKSSAEK
jgi:hypothetical protein